MMSVKTKFLNIKDNGFYPKNILDIGANVGEFTQMCNEIWPDTNCHSVEANRNCKIYLKKINCKHYIEVLGEENDKEINFYLTKENDICTGNSVYLEKTKHYSEENLITEKRFTKKLDTLFE